MGALLARRGLLLPSASFDPNWEYDVAQLHFEGEEGSQQFVDATGKQWVVGGSAYISTAQSRVGSSAGFFGLGSNRIYCDSAEFADFGVAPQWMFEGSVRLNSLAGSKRLFIMQDSNSKYFQGLIGDGVFRLNIYGVNLIQTSTADWVVGQWYDLAVARHFDNLYLFINGQLRATSTNASSIPSLATRVMELGSSRTDNGIDGYLDEVRFSRIARHTEDYAVSLPFIDGPSKLGYPAAILRFNEAVGSTEFYDEATKKSWNATGNAAIGLDGDQKALSCDGNSDSAYRNNVGTDIFLPNNVPFEVTTKFKIVGSNSLSRPHGIFGQCINSSGGEQGIYVRDNGAFNIDLRAGKSGPTAYAMLPGYEWGKEYSLRYVFDGYSHRVFIDGQFLLELNYTVGWTPTSTTPFRIGQVFVPAFSSYRFDLNGYVHPFTLRVFDALSSPIAEILTPDIGVNVALRKRVLPTFSPQSGTLSMVTDGITSSGTYVGADGLAHVIVDLGARYLLDRVNVRHYFADGRSYKDTKTQISEDGENWVTIFDSAVSGRYTEVSAGVNRTFTQQPVRYIRDYLNGSDANTGSHWVEIEAYRMT